MSYNGLRAILGLPRNPQHSCAFLRMWHNWTITAIHYGVIVFGLISRCVFAAGNNSILRDVNALSLLRIVARSLFVTLYKRQASGAIYVWCFCNLSSPSPRFTSDKSRRDASRLRTLTPALIFRRVERLTSPGFNLRLFLITQIDKLSRTSLLARRLLLPWQWRIISSIAFYSSLLHFSRLTQ